MTGTSFPWAAATKSCRMPHSACYAAPSTDSLAPSVAAPKLSCWLNGLEGHACQSYSTGCACLKASVKSIYLGKKFFLTFSDCFGSDTGRLAMAICASRRTCRSPRPKPRSIWRTTCKRRSPRRCATARCSPPNPKGDFRPSLTSLLTLGRDVCKRRPCDVG